MMTKDHSTTRSYRIHQFLRVCLLTVLAAYLLTSVAASGGSLGLAFNTMTAISLILGIFMAEVADWIMWGIAEGLGGENGLFSPQ